MSKQFKSNLCLFLAAVIWGNAFVAQSIASDSVGPCTFNGIRFFLGFLTLIPVLMILRKKQGDTAAYDPKKQRNAGIFCGIALALASILQQAGIQYTTAGKAGFITAFYVVLVPVCGLFFGKKVRRNVWLACGLAVAALYLLSSPENLSVNKGDLLEFLLALGFTVHILIIDCYGDSVDGVKLSCTQFLTASIICLIAALFTETISPAAVKSAAVPILYAGIMSAGAGYTLQIIGQRDANPAVASVLLSLESVFAAIGGFVILHQVLSGKELAGCILMFAAVIIAELSGNQ